MTTLREAALMALGALEYIDSPLHVREIDKVGKAINDLRMALDQPEQEPEPVAWECKAGGLKPLTQAQYEKQTDSIKRHYSRIPQREWQGLTDAEILDVYDDMFNQIVGPNYRQRRTVLFARAIERAHGIGGKE